MKKLIALLFASLSLVSCDNDEEADKSYHIQFQLKETDGTNTIHIPQEERLDISGNDILNSDFLAVGFQITGGFPSPANPEINHRLTISFGLEIPKSEFVNNGGKHEFIEAGNFVNYIPSGNLFNQQAIFASAYFHENTQTYCTALMDDTFDNNLEITKTKFYVDATGNHAVDIEGHFTIRFNSICWNHNLDLIKGSFRTKIMIDEIP
jgi:hypothetical protein